MGEYSGEIPLLYDNVPLYANRRDVHFYVEEAQRSHGTVLEVGCRSAAMAPYWKLAAERGASLCRSRERD